jgi:hypothetical protein
VKESSLKTEFERFVIENSRGGIVSPSEIWHNPAPRQHGFRLTSSAHLVLIGANVKSYQYCLKNFLRNRDLVDLDCYFIYPYYIENYKKFTVYSEQNAIMLTLYDGDLRAYLATLKAG